MRPPDGLVDAGVRPGHRVALLVPPGIDLTAAVYACWQAGAVIVVADAGLGWRRMADALRSADPDYLIGIPAAVAAAPAAVAGPFVAGNGSSSGCQAPLRQASGGTSPPRGPIAKPLPSPTAEAAVLFTSGATGPPKGVVYRHAPAAGSARPGRVPSAAVTPDDRLVAAFAPFALYGPALGIGAAVPRDGRHQPGTLTAAALADAAARSRPPGLRLAGRLTQRGRHRERADRQRTRPRSSGSGWCSRPGRRCGAAAAPRRDVLPHAELHTPYGMTEALPVTDISLPELEEAGSGNGVCVGRPLPGVRIRISPLDALGRAAGAPAPSPSRSPARSACPRAHVKDRYDRLWATEQGKLARSGLAPHRRCRAPRRRGPAVGRGPPGHVITAADGPITPVGVEQRIEAECAGDRRRGRRRRAPGHPAGRGRGRPQHARRGRAGGRRSLPLPYGRRPEAVPWRPC